MRHFGALVAVFAATVALAGQSTFKFERKYVEGEKEAFKLTLSMESNFGSIDILMNQNAVVKKVYENGDADLETIISGMKVAMNGQEMPTPAQDVTMMTKVSKSGAILSAGGMSGGSGMGMNLGFMRFATAGMDKPLTVGQTYDIDYKDPANPKQSVKGTVKLESITEGKAKLLSKLALVTTEGQPPMDVNMTTFVEVSSSKLIKLEGTASNVPGMEQLGTSTVQFAMAAAKS
ncbi:MAG: hypothetical protein M5U21_05260 [Fimbriimonadaceae bacterium]|mgnify:FL=1|nr:hypothetical protein [Fimbriimonadaceae bacterium]